MKRILIMIIALVAIALLGLNQVTGQKVIPVSNSEAPSASQQLYNEIERMDGVLFDAFNTQNLNNLKTLFTDDLEFYQDNEGLARYQQTMKDFESMFGQKNKVRREL